MITAKKYDQYALMANLFKYPEADLKESAVAMDAILRTDYPSAVDTYQRYLTWVINTPQPELEEVYAKTFHVQAICYLDLGYVIFGEDYKRGEFLVNMQREQADANNDCGDELSDNLANMLTLIPLLKDNDFREEMAGRIMIPALSTMLKEFEASRMKLKEKVLKKKHKALILENLEFGNIYKNALETLVLMLRSDFKEVALYDVRPKTDPLSAPAPVGAQATCGSCSVTTQLPTK